MAEEQGAKPVRYGDVEGAQRYRSPRYRKVVFTPGEGEPVHLWGRTQIDGETVTTDLGIHTVERLEGGMMRLTSMALDAATEPIETQIPKLRPFEPEGQA